jgi:hypothetical protein
MGFVTVGLILGMLLWALAFVLSGLVLAERVLWRSPAGAAIPWVSRMRKAGAVLLVAFGLILVAMTIGTAGLATEHAARFAHLEGAISRLETQVRAVDGVDGGTHDAP